MKTTVQVLADSGARRTKEGEVFGYECQCVVLNEQVEVGILMIFNRLAEEAGILHEKQAEGKTVKYVPAGAYELEYGAAVGWKDRHISGVLKSVRPLGVGSSFLASMATAFAPVPAESPSDKKEKAKG